MASRHARSPFDPDTHYSIIKSDTPVNVDGYKINEPKYLQCDKCGAKVLITPEPTPGIDAINHGLVDGERCPQWNARTRYWRKTHPDIVEQVLGDGPTLEGTQRTVAADGGRER